MRWGLCCPPVLTDLILPAQGVMLVASGGGCHGFGGLDHHLPHRRDRGCWFSLVVRCEAHLGANGGGWVKASPAGARPPSGAVVGLFGVFALAVVCAGHKAEPG